MSLDNLYTGSKLGAKYSFSDKDTSEETLIKNLAGFVTLYSLSAESSSVSLNSSEVGLLTSRKLRMERGGFGIDDYTTSNVFTDNFNRANGTLGSNWQIEQGSFQIINNAVNSTLGDATSVATVTSGTYSADQYAQITAATFTATLFDWIGVGVRVSGLSGYFYATDRLQTRKLFKRNASGVSTEIGTSDIYWSAGDIIRITANRNVISVYKNNELVERVKDSTYTSGVPAIYYRKENNSTTTGDNFECGNLIDSTNLQAQRKLVADRTRFVLDTINLFGKDATQFTRAVVNDSSLNTTIVGSVPSATVDGDLLIAFLVHGSAANPPTITPPAGWTTIVDAVTGNANFYTPFYIGYRIANGEPANYTWTLDNSGGDDDLYIYRVSKHRVSSIDVKAGTIGSGLSITTPSITTTTNNNIAVYSAFSRNGTKYPESGTVVGPEDATHFLYNKTRGFSGASITAIAYEFLSTARATGTKTFFAGQLTQSEYNSSAAFAIPVKSNVLFNARLFCDPAQVSLQGYDTYQSITSPAQIPRGLKGWFDASNTSSLTVSGNNLTAWNDLSGQNDHLDTIQGNNPQSGTRTINGLNAIEFNNDGAIYDLDNTGGVSIPELTVGFVFSADAASGYIVSSRTTLDSRIFFSANSELIMLAGSGNSQTSTRVLSTNQTYRVVAVYKGSESKLWINGVPEPMSSIIEDRLLIAMLGAGGAGDTLYFDGLIGEVAIYEQALRDSEALSLDEYFYKKWAGAKISAEVTPFSISTFETNLKVNRKLIVNESSFSIVYQEVSVTKSSAKKIEAITQTYSIISSEASLLRGLAIPVTAQAFTLTGPPVAAIANRVITGEGFRGNYLRNSMMLGAVAGTPGTAPTSWATAQSAVWVTRTIIGTGVDSTTGLTYIDVAYSGTNNTGSISSLIFDPISGTTQLANNGETWTSSAYFGLVSGSWPSNANILNTFRNSSGVGVGNSSVSIKSISSSTLQRFTSTFTANNVATKYVQTAIRFDASNGETVNFTVRIAAPQLERGSVAKAFIPTTNEIQYRWFETTVFATNLLKNSFLFANTGNFELSSFPISTPRTYGLLCSHATFAITSAPVGILKQSKLAAESRNFDLAEQTAALKTSRKLAVQSTSLSVVSQEVSLERSFRLFATSQSYTLVRPATTLTFVRKIQATSRTFTLSPFTIAFDRSYVLLATSSAKTITFPVTGVYASRRIYLTTQTYFVPIRVWDGGAWTPKPLKIWTGTEWQIIL